MRLPALVDNAPILARELRRAKDWFRKAEQLGAGVERFREVDVPQFVAWHRANFGGVLEDLERKERELARLADEHNQIVSLAGLGRLSARQACRQFRAEEDRYARGDDETRAEIEAERARRRAWLDDASEEDDDEEDLRSDRAEFGGAEFAPPSPRVDCPADERRLRIQSLFRVIARKLHPDSRDPALGRRKAGSLERIWTRAVRAKERGDLDELVVAHGQVLALTRELGSLGIADLRRLTEALAKVHGRENAEARAMRSAHSWNFSKLKSKEKLASKLARSYAASARELDGEIHQLLMVRRIWARDEKTRGS